MNVQPQPTSTEMKFPPRLGSVSLKALLFVVLADSVQVRVAAACSLAAHVAGEMLAFEMAAVAGAARPTNVPAITARPTTAVRPCRARFAPVLCDPISRSPSLREHVSRNLVDS